MKKKNVIHQDNLPTRIPLLSTATAWLLLDRFQPAGWVYGVVWTIFGIFWVISIVSICIEKRTRILGD